MNDAVTTGGGLPTPAPDENMEQGGAIIPVSHTALSTPDQILGYLALLDNTLSDVYDVADAKAIKDRADAVRYFTLKMDHDQSIKNRAAASQIRSSRRLSVLEAEAPKHPGGRPSENLSQHSTGFPQTYSEQGIDRRDVSRRKPLRQVPDEKIETFIAEADERGYDLTLSGALSYARNIVRKIERANRQAPVFPAGKYNVIYADPPWEYSNSGFNQSAESHYPTMPTKDIAALPIDDLVEENAVLFMWVTSPLLRDGLAVLDAWEFEYKASMVWVKNHAPGIGWFVQTYHEFLLIATRGSNHPDTQPKSVFNGVVSAHSRKPSEVYDTIEAMYPGPYIELFARRRERENWQVWGNEI